MERSFNPFLYTSEISEGFTYDISCWNVCQRFKRSKKKLNGRCYRKFFVSRAARDNGHGLNVFLPLLHVEMTRKECERFDRNYASFKKEEEELFKKDLLTNKARWIVFYDDKEQAFDEDLVDGFLRLILKFKNHPEYIITIPGRNYLDHPSFLTRHTHVGRSFSQHLLCPQNVKFFQWNDPTAEGRDVLSPTAKIVDVVDIGRETKIVLDTASRMVRYSHRLFGEPDIIVEVCDAVKLRTEVLQITKEEKEEEGEGEDEIDVDEKTKRGEGFEERLFFGLKFKVIVIAVCDGKCESGFPEFALELPPSPEINAQILLGQNGFLNRYVTMITGRKFSTTPNCEIFFRRKDSLPEFLKNIHDIRTLMEHADLVATAKSEGGRFLTNSTFYESATNEGFNDGKGEFIVDSGSVFNYLGIDGRLYRFLRMFNEEDILKESRNNWVSEGEQEDDDDDDWERIELSVSRKGCREENGKYKEVEFVIPKMRRTMEKFGDKISYYYDRVRITPGGGIRGFGGSTEVRGSLGIDVFFDQSFVIIIGAKALKSNISVILFFKDPEKFLFKLGDGEFNKFWEEMKVKQEYLKK